jgi:hypothetical protein
MDCERGWKGKEEERGESSSRGKVRYELMRGAAGSL